MCECSVAEGDDTEKDQVITREDGDKRLLLFSPDSFNPAQSRRREEEEGGDK